MIDPAIIDSSSNGTAQDIATTIAPMIVQVANDYGVVVTLLALVGIFAILNTMMHITMPITKVLGMVFVITPIIVITALTTKEKQYSLKQELRDVKQHAITNPKAVIGFVLYVLMFVVLVIIATYTSMRYGI